jgi:hypothetical protein
MKNEINKASFFDFVKDVLERKMEQQHTAPVGILDLVKLSDSCYMKIGIDLSLANKSHRRVRFLLLFNPQDL